jgi:hypothetical protein
MRKFVLAASAALLAACAGRDPQPIATVQPQDQTASCTQLTAEIQANNIKVQELADEQGMKVAQNVAAGVAGLVVWPLFFAMDFKGSASKDVAALQARQQYLTTLATEKCRPEPEPTRRSKPNPPAKPIAQAPTGGTETR